MRRFLARTRALARDRPWAFDAGLAALVAVLGVVSCLINERLARTAGVDFDLGWAIVAALVTGATLAGRRRWPLSALVVVTGAYTVSVLTDATEGTFSVIALFVVVYSAGAYGRRPAAHVVRAVGVAVVAGLIAWSLVDEEVYGGVDTADRQALRAFVILVNVFYFVAAWVMGDLAASRARREELLEAQAAELAEAHAEIARRAVGAERMRIARELHDVVAHHVSVMGVQAGAARRVLARDPDQAVTALASIEAASREAVSELHGLLGFLRQDGDVDTTAPLPTLGALDALVHQVADADVAVELTIEGVDGTVPAGLDLSAYRVVQEGLTNVVKHAGPGTRAVVSVRQRPEALEVSVVDDGAGRPRTGPARAVGGNGLVGMRERVALHGGVLDAGPLPDGGFAVRATFARRAGAPS